MFSQFKENMQDKGIRKFFYCGLLILFLLIFSMVKIEQAHDKKMQKEYQAKVIFESPTTICFQILIIRGDGKVSKWCVDKNHNEYLVGLIEARG